MSRRQRVHSRIEQLDPLQDGCLLLANDGKLKISMVSQAGLLIGTYEAGGKLTRSISYFSGVPAYDTTVFFSQDRRLLAIGHENGQIQLLGTGRPANCEELITFSSLPTSLMSGSTFATLCHLQWLDQRTILTLNRPRFDWILSVIDTVTAECKASYTLPYQNESPLEGKAPAEFFYADSRFFWLHSGDFIGSDSAQPLYKDVLAVHYLGASHFLVIKSDCWHVINVKGECVSTLNQNRSPYAKGFSKPNLSGITRLLYVDAEGWQWLVIFKSDGLVVEFYRFTQGIHDSTIQDVYFGRAIIVILRDTVMAIHDANSLGLVLWQPVYNDRKRKRRDSDDSTRHVEDITPAKRLLHVLEEQAMVLFKWGHDYVQVWNFGRRLACLTPSPPPKAIPKATKKAETQWVMQSEYAEWQEERQEQAQLERLRLRHNPDGMTEAELIALATAMSLTGRKGSPAASLSSFHELTTDDEELRRVLELSRYDM